MWQQNYKIVKIYFKIYLILAVFLLAGCSSIQNVISEDETKKLSWIIILTIIVKLKYDLLN